MRKRKRKRKDVRDAERKTWFGFEMVQVGRPPPLADGGRATLLVLGPRPRTTTGLPNGWMRFDTLAFPVPLPGRPMEVNDDDELC